MPSERSTGGDMREFFRNERGIDDGTLSAFEVEFPEPNVCYLPYTSGIKARRHDADGKRSFWFVEGNAQGLFLSPGVDDAELAFLVEGESDAMRLWQELDGEYPVGGLSGVNGWNESLTEIYEPYETVYVILDNDADYKVAATVDEAWRQIRKDLGPKAVRLNLPSTPLHVKDVCEFFDNYPVEVLRQIAETVPVDSGSYRGLDFTTPAPPTDWLVNGLVAKNDVTMLAGEPEVGKSFLTMDLAVAVLSGRDEFLGRSVMHHGRVYYIDEENPEDVVRQRLEKLGLSAEDSKKLKYVHHKAVRLDKEPERIIQDIMDFDPELVIIDSLTRIHTGDENSAGFIAQLFNDGINPIVRNTGAALLLLHHVNKSDGTSSFGRLRGSSDISGSIDAGYDAKKVGPHIHISNFKSRRARSGGMIAAEIVDKPDGSIAVVTKTRTVF